MKILVACEESQTVTIELRRLGHEAYSCDIIPCSGGHPEWHIQQDVLPLLDGYSFFYTADGTPRYILSRWDMIIAFPPCTYLSNAGARHLYPTKGQINQERYLKGLAAKAFFMRFLEAKCPKIAIENPVSSKVFKMPPHSQEIQPFEFDDAGTHPYTKKTRLWLKGLPELTPTTPDNIPEGPYIPAGTGRKLKSTYGAAKRGQDAINRSKTFPGIAAAMAEQWAGPMQPKEDLC